MDDVRTFLRGRRINGWNWPVLVAERRRLTPVATAQLLVVPQDSLTASIQTTITP
jgi:hypothetical protein